VDAVELSTENEPNLTLSSECPFVVGDSSWASKLPLRSTSYAPSTWTCANRAFQTSRVPSFCDRVYRIQVIGFLSSFIGLLVYARNRKWGSRFAGGRRARYLRDCETDRIGPFGCMDMLLIGRFHCGQYQGPFHMFSRSAGRKQCLYLRSRHTHPDCVY